MVIVRLRSGVVQYAEPTEDDLGMSKRDSFMKFAEHCRLSLLREEVV